MSSMPDAGEHGAAGDSNGEEEEDDDGSESDTYDASSTSYVNLQ